MTNTNMRKGFTMIELIFVIVIIGILAAVAIPKLAENRDNAAAKVCESEASGFVTEMAGYYTKNSGWDAIEEITNLRLGVTLAPGNGQNGLTTTAGTVPADGTGISYACNGEVILTLTPQTRAFVDSRNVTHNQYELDAAPVAIPTTQAAIIANTDLGNNGIYKTAPGYRIGGN